jgi:hypothetical protein
MAKKKTVAREFRLDVDAVAGETEEKQLENHALASTVSVAQFAVGEKVHISGITKAKGFQGVVKRHGFAGGRGSHGGKHDLRKPGSIGATFPEHVIKGRRMAGRMGADRFTVKNLVVDLVDVGRAGNFITTMNAKIFNDSMLAFLKQVEHVLVRKNSIHLPEFKLSELDNQFSRKVGKELSQSKLFHSEDFSVIPNLESHNWFKESFLSKQDERVMSIKKDGTSGVRVTTTYTDENKQGLEKKEEPASSKKIVEEKFLNPEQPSEGTDKEMLGRRQRVLQCLSYGGASIKDIWSQMKDVSEKTVQRDLLGLMREKKVIMLGKKRWAKYYLK